MKTIAYLRVSTTTQDCDNQRLAILDYAHQNQLTIDQFISVDVSSTKSLAQRGILSRLDQLQEKDILLVSELSRLGRSVGQIVTYVDQLIRKRVRFIAIKESIEICGATDISTKVMVTLFSLFAEIETYLCSQRTKEGLAKARANGKQLGRPKGRLGKSRLDGKEAEIRQLLKKRVSKASVARIMSVSETAVHHFIRTRKLGENPQ